jgi:hypothetical protein
LEVLQRTGIPRDSVVQGTWRQLQLCRDAAHPDEEHVAAAVAVGTDVLLVSDDPALPTAALSPSTSAATLHQPFGGNGFGGTFNLHQDGRLVADCGTPRAVSRDSRWRRSPPRWTTSRTTHTVTRWCFARPG